jgi:hypothetical protein
MTLIEQVVAAMIKLDLNEQHTIGELLHRLRKDTRPALNNDQLDEMTGGNPYGH